MRNANWKKILNKGNFAFALKKVIKDIKGNVIDCKFIDMNEAFENLFNIKVDEVIGRKLSDLISKNKDFVWIEECLKQIKENKDKEIVSYDNISGKYCRITNFFIDRNYFVTIINEVNLNELSQDNFEKISFSKKQIEKQEQLLAILDSTAEGIYGVDINGNCTFCNAACLRILGYDSKDEILGKNTHLLFHHHNDSGEESLGEDCTIKHVVTNGLGVHIEEDTFWRKDGSTITIEYFTYPQYHNDKIIGAVITFFDIGNRKKVEKELIESVRSNSVLLSNLPGMAYRCKYDPNWTMLFVSEGCYKLTGYKPEYLLNNHDVTFNEIIAPEYRDYLWKVWEKAVAKRISIREEYPIITAKGVKKWVLEQGQAVFDENGEVLALEGLIIDIDEQKKKEEEIRYLSYHDGLTGLHNRIYFEIQKSLLNDEKYLPLSIIIGDINGLKLINDAFGHSEGDKLIIATAKAITKCCREQDVVSRTGGDEFTILLPNTDGETAYQMLKNIKDSCEENTSVYKLNISLGFATKERMDEDFIEIQKLAEDFMYKRKLLGRNSIHNSIILSITATLYEKSHETEEHSKRMRILSNMLGTKLDLLQVELDELSLLATLHDIGKVSIDSKILNKPGKLTPEEWMEIKKHPDVGYRIAKASPELSTIADYILSHHERWDGKGYPQGLKGEDIPLLSRIISIVDAYDAMTSERTYREKISKEEALEEILKNSGTQFDPLLAQLFYEIMIELEEIDYNEND